MRVCACVRAFVRACVCACVCACMRLVINLLAMYDEGCDLNHLVLNFIKSTAHCLMIEESSI